MRKPCFESQTRETRCLAEQLARSSFTFAKTNLRPFDLMFKQRCFKESKKYINLKSKRLKEMF